MTTITVDFELTLTDFTDIVDTAVSCIDYWADQAEFAEPYHETDPEAILTLTCEDGVELYEVRKEDAEKAISLIVAGKVDTNDSIRGDIMSAVMEDDMGFIDGYAADAIIQVACFGDIIYG